jgi:hypothetical protein
MCWLVCLNTAQQPCAEVVCTNRQVSAGVYHAFSQGRYACPVGMTPPPRRWPKQCVRASSTCSGVQNAALSNGVHKARRP